MYKVIINVTYVTQIRTGSSKCAVTYTNVQRMPRFKRI